MELLAKLAARVLGPALALLLVAAPAAAAQDLRFPPSQDEPPTGYRLTAKRVIAIADREPKVIGEKRKRGKLLASAYIKGTTGQWQVSYFEGKFERAQVTIDDRTGAVLEAWTGPQVAWRMARGEPGAFAGKLNAPYVWIPLCVLFLVPFFDWRRPFRMLHLDLLVLLSFGVSHIFFNRGEISTSVPLVYPVLLYVLGRMLWIGFRGERVRPTPLMPYIPVLWVGMALVFLVGFRVALNVTDSRVIDVGYAGVIGADRVLHGHGLYGSASFAKDNEHGDTYGPANYVAYVPFVAAFGFDGTWGDLPAAHAAAIAFDLLTMLGLFLVGRRLRAGPAGTALGVALMYAWATFPYTLFALNCNSNDSMVAMVVVWALVALRSAPLRGLALGFGAAAKFAPLALAPLFATTGSRHRWRGALVVGLAVVAVVVAAFAPFIPGDGGLRAVYDRTLGYQAGRASPFSIWGQHAGLVDVWTAVKVLAVGLALVVALRPRVKTPVQVAALGAAVLVGLQLGVSHWFYLYIVWFAPFAFVAMFAGYRSAEPSPDTPPREVPAREPVLV